MDKKTILFRKKSLDKISESDQLTDYLRVSKPIVWLVLGAIIVFLIGLTSWSFIGNIDITAEGCALVEDGKATIILANNEDYRLDKGMKFIIDGKIETIKSVSNNDYGIPVGYAPVSAAEGKYSVSVIVRSSHPYELLFGV